MRIVVTGASGLIGTAVVAALRTSGHRVRRVVRRPPQASDEVQWDPPNRHIDARAFDNAEAVIHLAGAGIADGRWSDRQRRVILDSRIDGTATMAEAVAQRGDQIKVLLSASAVGWYGDRGDDVVDESDPAGSGFLADVVQRWEAATAPASDAGVRVATLRSGIVLSTKGGALGRALPLFRMGAGGRLGDGTQWMPWIAISDEVAAIQWLLDRDELSGAFNLVGPRPVRNSDYTAAIGKLLQRPTFATVPRFMLRLAFGDFADEGLLVSQRVAPRRLLESGFEFTQPDLDDALWAIISAGHVGRSNRPSSRRGRGQATS
jgi:uncharacterized protein (TIGR01777 family)